MDKNYRLDVKIDSICAYMQLKITNKQRHAMNNWQEIFTAYQVAQHGTVTKASEVLDVHRATVIRHIDSLEQSLGTKLFHRHSRGYTMTQAGEYFLSVAMTADEQFARLKVHLLNDELSGELIITSLEFIAPYILPAIAQFREQHPKVTIRYLSSTDLFKLEHAQAHIAIRTGAKPQDDDYVVKPFFNLPIRLFATPEYVEQFGYLTKDNIESHQFICLDDANPKPPVHKWMREHVLPENIIFTSNKMSVLNNATLSGLGIGSMIVGDAKKHGLVDVMADCEHWDTSAWEVVNWLVTHGDLHRSEKVQRFLGVLGTQI